MKRHGLWPPGPLICTAYQGWLKFKVKVSQSLNIPSTKNCSSQSITSFEHCLPSRTVVIHKTFWSLILDVLNPIFNRLACLRSM